MTHESFVRQSEAIAEQLENATFTDETCSIGSIDTADGVIEFAGRIDIDGNWISVSALQNSDEIIFHDENGDEVSFGESGEVFAC